MVDFNKDISKLLKSIGEIGMKMEVLQNKKNWKEVKNIQRSDADFSGVYVLWEKGKAIYVGLSKDVYTRVKNHSKGNISLSSFVSHLTREQVANHVRENKNEQKSKAEDYMISSIDHKDGITENKVREYIEDNKLREEIRDKVRERVEKMYFTCVEEKNDLQQFLLEVFCMKALKTITEEEEPRENIDKKNLKYIKYNFTY